MCCSRKDVDPSVFFERNGKRIVDLTWDHHIPSPPFLEHLHFLPELTTLACHPFPIVSKDASELRNLGRVESLVVSDYAPLDFGARGLDQGFFEKVDGRTMPALKTVVFKPGENMQYLWRG